MNSDIDFDAGDVRLRLLAERAVWVQSARLLLVADLHLGKATSFRHHGVPVPESTTHDNLARLSALIHRWKPEGIAFLGDFLHAPESRTATTLDALARWRQTHERIGLVLVRGNHDHRAGDPPAWLGAQCVDEPYAVRGATALRLCHHPQRLDDAWVVAGHVHPCTSLRRGFERLRLPCFHARSGCLTLPAFGAFTGMHPISHDDGDRVFAVAGDRVVEVARRGFYTARRE